MRLMNMLMLSCRKATLLLEKKLDTGLSPVEKIQLYLHTRMCDACGQYEKQSLYMDGLLKKQSETPKSAKPALKPLSEEVKSKIIKELSNR